MPIRPDTNLAAGYLIPIMAMSLQLLSITTYPLYVLPAVRNLGSSVVPLGIGAIHLLWPN